MNLIRKLASGKRNRYTQDHYNLDITYVTPRIIAMSFPACGVEKIYRNPICKVAKFLQEKHGDNYLVFNFSDRKYDYSKFDYRVESYDWRDHHAPKVVVLFEACKRMYDFLQQNDDNVVVVHCNAGKGRTGTSIACFLMYCGLAGCSADAINYYGWKRFSTGRGVSQPCQLRYIHYFEAALKREVLCSVPKVLECIIIKTIPKINQNGCKPYVDICNGDYQLVHSTKNSINLKKYKAGLTETEEFNIIRIVPDKKNLVIAGDAHFFIKHKGPISTSNICRFSINTGFVGNELVIPRNQMSPDSVLVSKKFHRKFQVTVVMRDYCRECSSQTVLEDLCERCKLRMQKPIKEWNRVNHIIEQHTPRPTKETGERLCFNTVDTCKRCKDEIEKDSNQHLKCPHIDYDEVTGNEGAVKVNQYSVIKASDSEEEQAKIEPTDQTEHKESSSKFFNTVDSAEQHVKPREEHKDYNDDEFRYVKSKQERNTMRPKEDNLEEKKDLPENYFRSVNEFRARENGNQVSQQNSKFAMKNILEETPQIEELSCSTSSNNSVVSDLDFRQKTARNIRAIRRYTRDPRICKDLEVVDKLRKFSFAMKEQNTLDHLEEFGGREKSHSLL
ncbi:unnamed protein product [Moneuplotes crassus]|uniref:Phosphatidylinositol-3,4,5-trisphosphate 3-phosphatase n=1 Tax=Euplotes crassus TaxID=5936 RepID=A0AAD2D861_EUPCR|nr:unnamed protein product [Moneuplotes crassus]